MASSSRLASRIPVVVWLTSVALFALALEPPFQQPGAPDPLVHPIEPPPFVPAPRAVDADDGALFESFRLELPAPYVHDALQRAPQLAFSADGTLLHAISSRMLFSFDKSGALVSEADLSVEALYRKARPNSIYVVGEGEESRLVATYSSNPVAIWQLDDSGRPSGPPLRAGGYLDGVLPLSGWHGFIVHGSYHETLVVDALTGQATATLPHRASSIVVSTGSTRWLALIDRDGTLATFDLSTPEVPTNLATRTLPGATTVAVDRSGSIVVVQSGPTMQVLDLQTAETLSTFEVPYAWTLSRLADGGGARVLVVAHSDGVELVDLADPTSPTSTHVDVDVFAGAGDSAYPVTQEVIAPYSQAPFVALAASDGREVVVVDVRTGDVTDRWHSGGAVPTELKLGEQGGAVRVAVALAKLYGVTAVEPGGQSRLALLDGGERGTLDLAASYNPSTPSRVARVQPMGGRYLLVTSMAENTLSLVDTATGEYSTGGFPFYDPSFKEDYFNRQTHAAGNSVVVWAPRRASVMDLVEGELVVRAEIENPGPAGKLLDAKVRDDGWVVLMFADRIETIGPAGERGRLEFVVTGFYPSLELDPGGRRVLVRTWVLDQISGYRYVTALSMLDLAEPSTPVLEWERRDSGTTAYFVRNGEAVLQTFDVNGWFLWFSAALFDASTGERLGPDSEPVPQWVYHGLGTRFGTGSKARAVYWRWTFVGYETISFDVSGPTPTIQTQVPDFWASPEYAPRGDDAWYEMHRYIPYHRPLPNDVYVGRDGALEWLGQASLVDLLPLRRGFLAGRAEITQRAIAVVRDRTRNRAPIAHAGPDRAFECAGPAGTPVFLDATASSDPDSAPGTQDDLATFGWSIDEAIVGDEALIEVSLEPGSHVATLSVSDVLESVGTDTAALDVTDTLPPQVSTVLEPVFESGAWSRLWRMTSSANDLCDGALGAEESLLLARGGESFEPRFAVGERTMVELLRLRVGLVARVSAPSQDAARALWEAVRPSWSLAVAKGRSFVADVRDRPVRLAEGELLARYSVGPDGSVATAEVFDAQSDIVMRAVAADDAGHPGSAGASWRAAVGALCTRLPADARCAPSR